MHRFFSETPEYMESGFRITGGDVNHIKNVLRMKPGEEICVVSGQDNREYRCRIAKITEEAVETEILEVCESDQELPCRITLFQGLPKGDKMEWVIQKAVELGVHTIVPVMTRRCVVKLDAKKEKNRLRRWNGISESAAKQSGRLRIPEVTRIMRFSEALQKARELDTVLIPYELAEGMEETRRVLGGIPRGATIGVFIGPEGGFEAEEVEQAKAVGAYPITLGRRILRTETAGLVTLAMLVYTMEN